MDREERDMKAGAKGWTGSSAGRGGGSAIASALAALLLALAIPTSAAALPETSPELPTRWCETGSGAGQCKLPTGLAADPRNGHVFVGDANNSRINEFNALGEFISAWGWDVVQSGPGNTGTGLENCEPDRGDVCEPGTQGGGTGQFDAGSPVGVAD